MGKLSPLYAWPRILAEILKVYRQCSLDVPLMEITLLVTHFPRFSGSQHTKSALKLMTLVQLLLLKYHENNKKLLGLAV